MDFNIEVHWQVQFWLTGVASNLERGRIESTHPESIDCPLPDCAFQRTFHL